MTAYANLLGTQLSELPPACQALHRNYGSWAGTITVETTRAPVLRTLLRLSGLPKEVQNAPFRFTSQLCHQPSGSDSAILTQGPR